MYQPPYMELQVTGGWLIVHWWAGIPHYKFRPHPRWWPFGEGHLPPPQDRGPRPFLEPSYVTTPALRVE
jgi:hypothetical protein